MYQNADREDAFLLLLLLLLFFSRNNTIGILNLILKVVSLVKIVEVLDLAAAVVMDEKVKIPVLRTAR